MAGLFPMIAALQRPFGIDENIGDILRLTDLAVAFADLKQRIIGRTRRIGRIKQKDRSKPRTPTGGQLAILALDVMDDGGIWPGQEGWDDKTNALPRPGRRKTQHVFGAIVSEIGVIKTTEHDPVRPKKSGASNFPGIGPTCRPIGRDLLGFFRSN